MLETRRAAAYSLNAMTTTLTLAIERGLVAPRPDVSDPATLVWVDYEGIPSAYFYRAEDEYWAYLPAVGAFRSEPDGRVIAVPNEHASDALVVDTYRRTIAPMSSCHEGAVEACESEPVPKAAPDAGTIRPLL